MHLFIHSGNFALHYISLGHYVSHSSRQLVHMVFFFPSPLLPSPSSISVSDLDSHFTEKYRRNKNRCFTGSLNYNVFPSVYMSSAFPSLTAGKASVIPSKASSSTELLSPLIFARKSLQQFSLWFLHQKNFRLLSVIPVNIETCYYFS